MTNDVKKVPELRFPEFSGEWEEKMLGDVLTILDGDRGKNYPSGSDFLEYGHTLFLNASNVTKNGFSFTLKQYITEKKSISMGNGKLVKNDVVLTTRGSIGNIGWYDEEIYRKTPYARINSGMLILRSNNKDMASFVSQFLMSTKGKRQIDRISFGSAQPQLTKKDIKLYRIDFPQIKEQQKIGDFFSKLDRQIELEEQKLKKLEEQKKGYMQKIFSQELRFKDEKGNYYPEWESRYLNELCLINPKVDQVPNSFLYIDLESVNNGKIEKIKEVNKINAPSRAQRLAKKYDVFYQTVRPYQKNNFINLSNRNDIVVSTGYAQLRPSVQFYYLYSLLLTNSFMNKVLVKCTGTNYPAINSTDLSLIQILSSSVFEEQEKIGNFFSKLDELINKQNQKIDGLKKRKRGFLQKMFV